MQVLYFVLPYSEDDKPLFTAWDYVPEKNSVIYYHPDPDSVSRDKYVVSGSMLDVRGREMTVSVMLAKQGG